MKPLRDRIRFGPLLPLNHVFLIQAVQVDSTFGLGRGRVRFAKLACGPLVNINRVGAAKHLGLGFFAGDVGGPTCPKCRRAITKALAKAAACLGFKVALYDEVIVVDPDATCTIDLRIQQRRGPA